MHRRQFLISSAAAGAAFSASPNDTIRAACVGLRGRGRHHMASWASMPGAEVAALCDIDESVLAARLKELEGQGRKRPAVYTDYRKLLEDKSIDVVSIATPNHWHALQTIWACQAGKDVYVEKPCTHNMFEVRQIVAAARKYNRIVQQGSQARSSPALQDAMRQMREGLIGDVYMARGLCFKWRGSIRHAASAPVPQGVDYNLWLGPAPVREFSPNRFHYKWHWWWDYGNGDLGNQGIHELDIARWGLGVRYPSNINAMGGHVMFDDDQETPNVLNIACEFNSGAAKKLMTFEVRHWMTNHEAGIHDSGADPSNPNTIGNVFYGSKGYLAIDGYAKYQTYLGKEQQPGPSGNRGGNHFANFASAVRSRNRRELTAEIEEGAVSTAIVHLANISYRLGRTLNFDERTFRCVGDDEANRMFTRAYRAPFVVPAKV
ncbi:MAG TPA: Gfo/Idh/MocA family oxidoreductase [Bryobacteraceae bacterium]|nr:Gfo/Idh/MocA family oxidoreductase [Bryobacteraceae bacterium]